MLKHILKSRKSQKNRNGRSLAKRTLAFENLQDRELMAADMGLADPALADAPVAIVDSGLADAAAAEAASENTQGEQEVTWPPIKPGYKEVYINGQRWYVITGTDKDDYFKIDGEKIWHKYGEQGKWTFVTTLPKNNLYGVKFETGEGADNVTINHWSSDVGNIGFVFEGGAGNDHFTNNTSLATKVYGGAGNDELQGGSGNDEIHGGAGDDKISGGAGVDELYGDADNDTFWDLKIGDSKNSDGVGDKMDGGTGRDFAYYGASDNVNWKNVEDGRLIGRAASAAEDNELGPRVPVQEERSKVDDEDLDQDRVRAHDAYFASLGEDEAKTDRPSQRQDAVATTPELMDLAMGDLSLLV